MFLFLVYCVFGFITLHVVNADNNDLVVLVHGLASSAETWDYADEIRQSGLEVLTLSINGYESNHDRAVTLFAKLKGTRVDYGICHSKKFGHSRFGDDYTGKGLYPEWGSRNRIHFVGHSMGGQTIRALERLLERGTDCRDDTFDLFQGGKNWITSITTLATPHDGTTAPEHIPFGADEFFINAFVSNGGDPQTLTFPQWGLVPEPGESARKYLNRVEASGIFFQDDFSFFDLSRPGAEVFNSDGPAVMRRDRYYFSYALERTSPGEDCVLIFFSCDPVEEADREMSFALSFAANLIGEYSDPVDRPNDGIVNQARARCPGELEYCKEVPDDLTSWSPGQWHYIDIGYLDHFQITTRDSKNDKNNFLESAQRIYLQIGSRLKGLNSKSLSRLTPEEEFENSEKAYQVRAYLDAVKLLTTPVDIKRKSQNNGLILLVVFVVLSLCGAVYMFVKRYKARPEVVTQETTTNIFQATL